MKYVALNCAPVAWKDWEGAGWQDRPTCVVHDDCIGPVNTGLLNADGVPLYRVKETVATGFHASACNSSTPEPRPAKP